MALERQTDEELQVLARRIITNEIYAAWTPEALENSFGTMIALSAGTIDQETAENIGLVYEEAAQAGTWAVNGYPTFLSMKLLHKDDVEPLVAHLQRMEAALGLTPKPESQEV